MQTTLIVPGLRGSEPDHWQSHWERHDPTARRVMQADWNTPDLSAWSARVAAAIHAASGDVWLVAHSFGCLASVRAGTALAERVAGALLVAPASPGKFGFTGNFPQEPLPFPTWLVASSNDPWMSLDEVREWGLRWRSWMVCLGEVGHINVASGFGPWPLGFFLLDSLRYVTHRQRQQTGQILSIHCAATVLRDWLPEWLVGVEHETEWHPAGRLMESGHSVP